MYCYVLDEIYSKYSASLSDPYQYNISECPNYVITYLKYISLATKYFQGINATYINVVIEIFK